MSVQMQEAPSHPLLRVSHVGKEFSIGHVPVFGRRRSVAAVSDVSFDVHEGETVAIVGESGCGKSTLARVILRLEPATSGSVEFYGEDVAGMSRARLKEFRKSAQIVFQDPFGSLNPRMTVGELVGEPALVNGVVVGHELRPWVDQLLVNVGLSPDAATRYPHQFSGGQRQRIGIARALSTKPKLLVCDEAVSALDVSIRAQILNLITDLKSAMRFAVLFISHDLSVVRHVADRVGVMYLGRLVELGSTDAVFESQGHPYTEMLLSAVPVPDPEIGRRRVRTREISEPPSPFDPPSGCRFRTRCAYAIDRCASEVPALRAVADRGMVACHLAERPRGERTGVEPDHLPPFARHVATFRAAQTSDDKSGNS